MNPAQGGSLIHVAIEAEKLFQIGPLSVTNSMIGALLASLVLLLGAWWFTRRATLIPNRFQSVLELPIELLGGILAGSSSRWRGYAALVFGFFIMILVANWIGLLPGVGTIGINEVVDGAETFIPIVRPAAADLNFTLGLAIVAFCMFIFWGIRANGAKGYLLELIGEPRYMAPLMFPINLISEMSRLISLSMRLFGNVFAGEVLLATMIALVPILVPAVFLGLELLFGFVQALVFALLAMTYISTAIAEHHTAGDGADHDEPDAAAGRVTPRVAEAAHA